MSTSFPYNFLAKSDFPTEKIKQITERIAYLPAEDEPLSSDIGLIRGDDRMYVFDVGSSPASYKLMHCLPDNKAIIISHFHADHTRCLAGHLNREQDIKAIREVTVDYHRPRYSSLYVSKVTAQYCSAVGAPDFCDCSIVTEPITIRDGVKIDILPLPCTHSKGSLILQVDDAYAFMGDSTYSAKINGDIVYNAQLLQQEITVIEGLSAEYLLLSHDRSFVRPRKVILRQLKAYYDKWDRTDSYIRL